jgi:poly-beta-1,6-N-acetyl-D-glucosamine synthase
VRVVERERLTYAVVTPARNEANNLPALAQCLADQALRPEQWLIVDNGSIDETVAIAEEIAERWDWVSVTFVAGEREPTRGGPVAKAFMHGIEALGVHTDIVVKVDADITFDPEYFDGLLSRFEADETLGIAGGTCYELDDGQWQPRHVTLGRVRGATRAYRRACLDDVLPLESRPGWDGIDELKAGANGWRTTSFDDLAFYHHREVGRRDSSLWKTRAEHGRSAYYVGYRFPYLLLRALFRSRGEPAALAMVWGYVDSALRRASRSDDSEARELLRSKQRLRELPSRAREARGHKAGI